MSAGQLQRKRAADGEIFPIAITRRAQVERKDIPDNSVRGPGCLDHRLESYRADGQPDPPDSASWAFADPEQKAEFERVS